MKLKWTLPVLLVTLTAAAQIPLPHQAAGRLEQLQQVGRLHPCLRP